MTSLRGLPRRTSHGDESTDSYLLTPTRLPSKASANYPEEDLYPDSDASLLGKHHDEDDDDHGEDKHDSNISSPNILLRLITFMSQTPLLPGSSQAPEISSYGALPAHGPTGSGGIEEEEEEEEDEDNEISRRGRRKGKSTDLRYVDTIRPTRSMGTLRSQNRVRSTRSFGTLRSQNGSESVSRRRTRRSEPAPENIYASGAGLPTGDGTKLFEGLAPTMSTEHLDIEEGDEDDGDEEAIVVDGEESEDDDEDPPDNSPCPTYHADLEVYFILPECVAQPHASKSFVVSFASLIFYAVGLIDLTRRPCSYPQVRASVSATDNTSLSISTPRMWTLSLLFALLGSGTNLFFSLRYPSVAITPVIALVLVHPLGKAWDKILKRDNDPQESFDNGLRTRSPARSSNVFESRGQRLRLWLAQGKWNEKEHACVYISSNVSFGFAFATDVIVEQVKFYHQDPGVLYQLLLTISTQILGYAFAGLTRRYLVRPPSMIWPGTLMSTAMFTTMHKTENKIANGWTILRWRFFIYVWSGAVAWYFLPGLLMPALSYFSVITWFAPKNVVVANLFGVASGLGLFPMTFDWAQIAYIGSPLLTPWWAAANVVGGLVLVMWIIAPILYYKNVLYSSFMPILSSAVFDDTGKPYDVSRILTPDFLFDREAYEKYSRVYLPITYVLAYAVQFAGLSALVTHTACWHGKDIWKQSNKSFAEDSQRGKSEYQPVNSSSLFGRSEPGKTRDVSAEPAMGDDTMGREDVYCRLMKKYEDVPIGWYIWTFAAMLAIGIFVVEYYPVHLPWYGLLLALSITSVLFIPVGIVMAITNQHSSLYLICQLVCGVVFPGRPVANMVFVTYCYISSAQGIKFSSDLKLGRYMKIPPKLLFTVQMVATLVSSVTQIGVLNWMFAYIPGLCTPQAIDGFNCPIARVHFNGSILWGVVGPQRFFGPGALYRHLIWAFLIGAIAPIAIWLVARRHKTGILRKINLPVLFGSLSWIPPATGLNFSVWAVVCFLFNYLIRRRASAWWGKYTMTLSAALDSGLAFALVVVFFGFVYPGWMDNFHWWGTEVYKQGCDWQACSYRTVAPGEHFGPK